MFLKGPYKANQRRCTVVYINSSEDGNGSTKLRKSFFIHSILVNYDKRFMKTDCKPLILLTVKITGHLYYN